MADLVIQNPSITTNVFEYDDAGRVSAISGHPLAGEGGGEIVKSDLMWKPTVGDDGYVRWTLASSATEPDAAYISGAQGPQGNPGTNGTNGTNGADGVSPTFTITPTAGGTHVVLSGAQGEDSFDVLSGAKGADGTAGFSPTVSTNTTATEDRTGTVLTFTYGDEGGQTVSYTAWNGKDGTCATVDLLEGDGIQITQAGTTYTIGVSADYLQSVSVAANGSLAGSGTNNNPLSLKTSAENALAAVDGKVNKPATSLVDKYLVLRTDNNGAVSGWCDFNDQSYSKSEADGKYVQQTFIDTTLSGIGANAGNKLGANTDVIPTKDWLDDNYLPLSGGTVSGKTTISGSGFNTLEIIRSGQASTGIIGINGAGGMSFKAVNSNNNNTQLNIAPNATMDKRFSIGDDVYDPSAYFIPAVTSTTTAGLTNDGILHIILES